MITCDACKEQLERGALLKNFQFGEREQPLAKFNRQLCLNCYTKFYYTIVCRALEEFTQ